MMKEPLVSVVMPAYNCKQYVEQAVRSVQEQSCGNWELIIVDDCSTDGTFSLLSALAEQDERIRVFRNPVNAGAGMTRNHGVAQAKGTWVAFLDSDDLWTADKLEKQLALLRRIPEAGLLYSGSAFITSVGRPLDYVLHVPEKIDRKELLKQNLISCSSTLVRRDLLLKYPMSGDKHIHEDFVVWLNILQEIDFAYGIDEPLLIYRRAENSKSGNKLKAACMNWNAYRRSGLSVPQAIWYMGWYAARGIRKYRNLK